jgi:DNA-binding NarL/FixJ family response regulator
LVDDADRVRVVVADDHPAQRAGIRAVLEDGGMVVVAEAATADAAVAAVEAHQPEIALLDVRMPGDGIVAAGQISLRFPDTAVVMLTVSTDEADVFRALRAGAYGFLPKDMDPERLPAALLGVLHGEVALPRSMVRRALEEFGGRQRRRLTLTGGRGALLTEREWEVLDLLREGATTAAIADALDIGQGTVRTHIAALLHKLRVPDRRSALALIREEV